MIYRCLVISFNRWSIRALICLKLANIKYQSHLIDLSRSSKVFYLKKNPYTGQVPFLKDKDVFVYDSLSILEYLQELTDHLLPVSIKDRAMARSLCSEMHSGFSDLRKLCPYTLDKNNTVEISKALSLEIQRVNQIFESAKNLLCLINLLLWIHFIVCLLFAYLVMASNFLMKQRFTKITY